MTHNYKAALLAINDAKEFNQPETLEDLQTHIPVIVTALKIADRLMQGPPRSTPERIWQVTRDHLLKEVEQKND